MVRACNTLIQYEKWSATLSNQEVAVYLFNDDDTATRGPYAETTCTYTAGWAIDAMRGIDVMRGIDA